MKITVLGKEVTLKEDQYLFAKDSGKLVLRNNILQELMKEMGVPEPEIRIIPEGTDAKAGIFLVEATLKTADKGIFREYGESNPRNLKNDISKEYPFSIAKNRAEKRVILRALGLSGSVLSEDEIDKKQVEKPQKNANTAAKKTEPVAQESGTLTREQAGEVKMHFGTVKGKMVKDFNKYNVDYVLKLKPTSEDNIRLINATKIYHGQ